jgi:hypothetical protein
MRAGPFVRISKGGHAAGADLRHLVSAEPDCLPYAFVGRPFERTIPACGYGEYRDLAGAGRKPCSVADGTTQFLQ